MYPEGTFFRVLKSIKLYPFMKKDFIQNAGARYESPECSVIAFGFEGVLCGSYGEEGEAGAKGTYNDYLGEDY